jgi:hypothetical protein
VKVVACHNAGPRVRAAVEPTPPQNRTNAAWLRDQLAALRMRLMFGPGVLTTADICRAMAAIDRGEDFREVIR